MLLPAAKQVDQVKEPIADRQQTTNPYVFLVGCPRSGTTMLKRMVAAHPQIAVTRETHWVARYYERRKGLTEEGRVTPAIVDTWFDYHRFAHMKVTPEQLAQMVATSPGAPYPQFVSKLYDKYGERKGKSIVGDKTPTYVRKIPILRSLWPHARFVHLIRDGRDVWLSMRNWRMVHKAAGGFATWHSDPVVTTALWWKALVAIGCQDGAVMDSSHYKSIYYEQLVSRSDQECRDLAAFLQLQYHPKMPRYYEGHTSHSEDGSANRDWLPPTPGLRNWRTQMDSSEIESFEAAAGDLLHRLGYELGCPKVGQAVRRRVERVKQAFTCEVQQRRWRLPDLW